MAKVTRRQFLKGVAAGGTAMAGSIMAPGVLEKAYAQKVKLKVLFENHWVPGAADIHKEIIDEWARKNNVEININLVPQVRDLRSIASAEYKAGAGHDVMMLGPFDGASFKKKLEPLNDVVGYIQKKYGKFDEVGTYLSYQDGIWVTVPTPIMSHSYPMVSRIDLFREHVGINLLDLFPTDFTKREKAKVDAWTYGAFLEAAKKLHNAGYPFGNPISKVADANDWLCPLFLSFGSVPVDKDGNVTLESDGTLQALEFMKELTQYMPKDIYGWDEASNNRWIISGKGSCIQNPPSAWAVCKRTRPDIAAQLWHHDTPSGPKGRYRGALFVNIGVWKWCKEKKAAKELIVYLLERPQQWKTLHAAQGYDMPQLKPMYAHPVWREAGPPKGTTYNYIPRGDEQLIVGGWPATPEIGAEIYNRYIIPTMVAKATTGEMSPKEAMKWAAGELEMIVR
jgi:ABC-type glycerol-3-phosphate transport system substrate-binding protein